MSVYVYQPALCIILSWRNDEGLESVIIIKKDNVFEMSDEERTNKDTADINRRRGHRAHVTRTIKVLKFYWRRKR